MSLIWEIRSGLDPYENLRDRLVLGMAAFGIWVIQCSAVMCAQSASCYASLILIKSFEDEGKDKESGVPMTCYKSSKAWAAPLMYTLFFGYHAVNVLIINPEDIVEFDATICHICHMCKEFSVLSFLLLCLGVAITWKSTISVLYRYTLYLHDNTAWTFFCLLTFSQICRHKIYEVARNVWRLWTKTVHICQSAFPLLRWQSLLLDYSAMILWIILYLADASVQGYLE